MQNVTRASDAGSSRRDRLGAAIRAARLPRPQTDLAADLGRPQASISQWESGHVDLSMERVFQLEGALGVPHGHLSLEAGYLDLAELYSAQIPVTESNTPLASGPSGFPENVRRWIEAFGPLLEALILLRDYGAEPSAVDALLATRPLRTFRLSWEFLAGLELAADEQPEWQLAELLGPGLVVRCRYALWGQRSLQLVPPTA